MESETVPSGELAPPVLKSEAGEEVTCLEQRQAVTSEARTLEQGQGLAGFAARGYALRISSAVPRQDTSGVLAPGSADILDALPIMSGRSGPTVAPLSYDSGVSPTREVAMGPSFHRWWWW